MADHIQDSFNSALAYGQDLALLAKQHVDGGMTVMLVASVSLGFAAGVLRQEGLSREQVHEQLEAIMCAGDAMPNA